MRTNHTHLPAYRAGIFDSGAPCPFRACLAFIGSLCQLFFGQDQVGSRIAYLKVRASETTWIAANKQLARRVRDQWPPAASPVLSGVSTDAKASLFTAFLADRHTGSRTEWFNESQTCSNKKDRSAPAGQRPDKRKMAAPHLAHVLLSKISVSAPGEPLHRPGAPRRSIHQDRPWRCREWTNRAF